MTYCDFRPTGKTDPKKPNRIEHRCQVCDQRCWPNLNGRCVYPGCKFKPRGLGDYLAVAISWVIRPRWGSPKCDACSGRQKRLNRITLARVAKWLGLCRCG